MHPVTKLKTGAAAIVAATAIVAVAGLLFASGARTEELKHYDSSKKDFWLHPPDDWFMGDETEGAEGHRTFSIPCRRRPASPTKRSWPI